MRVLLGGLGLFALGLAAHLLLWRVRRPERGVRALLGLFLAAGLLGGALGPRLLGAPPLTPAEAVHAAVLLASLALAYIVVYTAVEVDSPSLSMVLRIGEAGEGGIEPERLAAGFGDERLVLPRLRDLVRSGAVSCEGDVYRLRAGGGALVALVVLWRRVMGLPIRGG